jgi:hypothetical protein
MLKHSHVAPLVPREGRMRVANNSGAPMRKKTTGATIDSDQLGLFDIAMAPAWTPIAPVIPRSSALLRQCKNEGPPSKTQADTVRLVALEDMPTYPTDVLEMVDRSIATIPDGLVWLTYRDIGKYFGISRATIARRLKDGLVPGVRFQHGRMLDDGPVRRFDRVQLRWLLLAVRVRAAG